MTDLIKPDLSKDTTGPLTAGELDRIEADHKVAMADSGYSKLAFWAIHDGRRLLNMARQSVSPRRGFVAVPIAPTLEMLAAADSAIPRFEAEPDGSRLMGVDGALECWNAMLNALAAPPPAAAVSVEEIGQKITDPPSSDNRITDLEGSPDTQGGAFAGALTKVSELAHKLHAAETAAPHLIWNPERRDYDITQGGAGAGQDVVELREAAKALLEADMEHVGLASAEWDNYTARLRAALTAGSAEG